MDIKKYGQNMLALVILISSILMEIGIFVILFDICKDYLKDRVHNKTLHKEFKYIQLFYILACIILIILCTILIIGFFNILITNN